MESKKQNKYYHVCLMLFFEGIAKIHMNHCQHHPDVFKCCELLKLNLT